MMKCGINMIKYEPVYKYKQLKTKVRKFDGVIKTNFLGKGMPKEDMHYTCIACITIDSVKYKIKEAQMPKFIKTELKSDSDSDLDSDLEKMEAKIDNELEFISDNDSVYDTVM